MSKRIYNALSVKNQQPLHTQNMLSTPSPKKPRKVVKKQTQVSPLSHTLSSQQTLNFYETIPQVPTYYLSKQQMNADPIQLLNKLQQQYKQFGAIKVVVNDAWNSPFTFRYVDKEITTRIQCLQKLKQGKAFQQKVRAYRISHYQAMANAFSNNYRYRTNPSGQTEQSKRQQEYWNLLTKSEYDKKPVTVQYAADLSTSNYGSGFPKHKVTNWLDADFDYETNLWNLNNISKSPSSLLSICQARKQKISGISYPWLYMGMMFSTFCWHVEDLFLNSLNYNHKGATKTWYIVPGSYKQKFDAFVQKKFEGNNKKKNILQKIILMIDPKQLIAQGIKVYKANQRPRQYVCTFIKAYHAGFSHGFNVGEAVNFLSAKCLKPIQQAEKYYNFLQNAKNFKPKPLVLSKQWLVYENIAQNKIKKLSQQEKFIVKLQYEKLLKHEQFYLQRQLTQKQKIRSINIRQKVNIIPSLSKYEKISCQYCKNYIYLSAIECKKCGILCESHIGRCECEVNVNGFQIWVRQSNKDRMKSFAKYPIILQAIKNFQLTNKKDYKQHSKRGRTSHKQQRKIVKYSSSLSQKHLPRVKSSKNLKVQASNQKK